MMIDAIYYILITFTGILATSALIVSIGLVYAIFKEGKKDEK